MLHAQDLFESILDGSFSPEKPSDQALCKAQHVKAPIRARTRLTRKQSVKSPSETVASPGAQSSPGIPTCEPPPVEPEGGEGCEVGVAMDSGPQISLPSQPVRSPDPISQQVPEQRMRNQTYLEDVAITNCADKQEPGLHTETKQGMLQHHKPQQLQEGSLNNGKQLVDLVSDAENEEPCTAADAAMLPSIVEVEASPQRPLAVAEQDDCHAQLRLGQAGTEAQDCKPSMPQQTLQQQQQDIAAARQHLSFWNVKAMCMYNYDQVYGLCLDLVTGRLYFLVL